ncbi:MAG: 7-cyano-7-deazaguanine synthase QueC [Melioribacteraceae bacterium]|nr:7-cyano-7-deazaguanine synthase QueC [Melioribacteraceae bacterium]MCF8355713.1 7-cyano-7-deazaguanine synthase QueC [Melioribacteraceae bacterium]MCF8394443.1 7-cyano-7-deazaguanine synthase QueC [Melioribacteraceae bacterium]MCF8418577.1 7-cyano-7-deazaguanine synthase QueC [Melioribacteraceae bacterium]
MSERKLAIVALSGGMDSCVTAAIAKEEYDLAFLHINYGQRTENRELQAFHEIVDYFDVEKRTIIDFTHFKKIGGSSLTDQNIEVSKADLNNINVPSSYVPFRNANILSVCGSLAEVIGASAIFIGAVHEDSSGYPDCRPDFFKAFERVLNLGTKPETKIEIITPIIQLSKEEIIKKGVELSAPLHLTWSCYKSEDKACGVCDSCALRLRGFQKAGIEDPIEYENKPVYD